MAIAQNTIEKFRGENRVAGDSVPCLADVSKFIPALRGVAVRPAHAETLNRRHPYPYLS